MSDPFDKSGGRFEDHELCRRQYWELTFEEQAHRDAQQAMIAEGTYRAELEQQRRRRETLTPARDSPRGVDGRGQWGRPMSWATLLLFAPFIIGFQIGVVVFRFLLRIGGLSLRLAIVLGVVYLLFAFAMAVSR